MLLFFAILGINLCFGQTVKVKSDSTKFNKIVFENTSSFQFDGTKPIGKGWDILEKQFSDNQFVAWGEYHNSKQLSQLSSYVLEAASKNGFKNWCVETSPFVAKELKQISRTKNPVDSIIKLSKDKGKYGTFPFFRTKEDAEMLVVANKYNYNIWGIDQEYQMAFTYVINKAFHLQSPNFKARYQAVYDSLIAKWWMPKVKLLDSLKKGITQPELKAALEDIKISRTIYYEDNNLMRATLMKKNFYQYYDHTKDKNKKVFFKLGANHLAKGQNLSTHLYDLGNAVFELSQHNQTNFANVFFLNRYYITEKGELIDDLEDPDGEYPKEFLKLYQKDQWVVVDMRPLRVRYKNDKTLSEATYQIMDKYDFIVVSPEVMK
ncbi:hypothetical protein [Flectobacillus roseus]|uniref:hypothetical protein n=1 Tax=Flectobacillus roseus TaxID=502259 RepID=UPI0024B66337|nr:hypothetical protein [Flectobacillus roseus]MDI9867900.1 hypothetical protein [Flectobacillus roseus]